MQDTAAWWDFLLPEAPMAVPFEATMPMYSTWYSYHQDMTDKELETECETAYRLGMRSVIIDDGWETSDNNRGYGYCGDWKMEPSKFPDFRRFTDRLHQLGMKCLLWYSVPFVGEYSQAWKAFHSCCLHYDPALHAGVLDPRYPQVRQYLISTYRDAVTLWDLDGFKLDFIDSFRTYPDTPPVSGEMDEAEIQDAVYRLMLDIRYALTEVKPHLMLEFRQNYVGSQMRRFGNLFRVGDCPLSGITNCIGITDLKLLCGSSAVHSDMLTWNPQEAPEDVAIQLIHCIFATLQISVKLNSLRPEQRAVLEHYLRFSIAYKEVLQGGAFFPSSPQELYPVLEAAKGGIRIAAIYDSQRCVDFSGHGREKELWILNGTHGARQYVLLPQGTDYDLTLYDCSGTCLSTVKLHSPADGISVLSTMPGGSLCLRRCGGEGSD